MNIKILGFISEGKENAISAQRLAEISGARSERCLRGDIAELRKAGKSSAAARPGIVGRPRETRFVILSSEWKAMRSECLARSRQPAKHCSRWKDKPALRTCKSYKDRARDPPGAGFVVLV